MPAPVAERPSLARQAGHRLASLVNQDYAGPPAVNVGQAERWATIAAGGALGVFGLTRDSLPGYLLAGVGGMLLYRGLTGHCQMYQALDINTAHPRENPRTSIPTGEGVQIEDSVTINRPAAELFRFWRNFENLPRVMKHLESVKAEGKRSHWVAKGPLGMRLEWDAEVITERPNELIGWRSLDGSTVATAGSVHFRELPGGHGTEIHVVLKYEPPAGKLGAMLARAFGSAPEQEIAQDLRTFKTQMEAGELPSTEGQPRGSCC
jgi:uncharacterized membrane protein